MKSYDQYMAESGQQSYLDQLRKSGEYDSAKSLYNSQGGATGGGSSSRKPIKFDIPDYNELYNKSYDSLEAYYSRLLQQEGGDVTRVKARLKEDYERGVVVSDRDFNFSSDKIENSFVQGKKELDLAKEKSDNTYKRTLEAFGLSAEQAERALQTDLYSRGIQSGGIANTLKKEFQQEQSIKQKAIEEPKMSENESLKLRQEALQKAFELDQQDIVYGKEDSLYDTIKTQRRGEEDVSSAYDKYKLKSKQEQAEKAVGLAGNEYSRIFAENQARAQMEKQAQEPVKFDSNKFFTPAKAEVPAPSISDNQTSPVPTPTTIQQETNKILYNPSSEASVLGPRIPITGGNWASQGPYAEQLKKGNWSRY